MYELIISLFVLLLLLFFFLLLRAYNNKEKHKSIPEQTLSSLLYLQHKNSTERTQVQNSVMYNMSRDSTVIFPKVPTHDPTVPRMQNDNNAENIYIV